MQLNSFRTLGRSGLRVSPITLGGLAFGDADDQTSTALLDPYLAADGNFIDAANVYNGGRSEETIGAYLDKHRACPPGRYQGPGTSMSEFQLEAAGGLER